MDYNKFLSNFPAEYHKDVIPLIFLFKSDFSIDWLLSLSDSKPSDVLSVLENGISQKWLKKKKTAIYCIADSVNKNKVIELFDRSVLCNLHQKISNFFMSELPEGDDSFLTIAYHLLNVPNDIYSCRYLIAAGDFYCNKYCDEESIKYYVKAIDSLAGVDSPEAERLFVEVATNIAKISTAKLKTNKAINILKRGIKLAKNHGMLTNSAILHLHLAKCKWLSSNYSLAIKYFKIGRSISMSLDNSELTKLTNVFSSFFLFWQGRYKEIIDDYEKISAEIQNIPRRGSHLLASLNIAQSYVQIGQITRGLGIMDSIQEQCLEIGNKSLGALTKVMIGWALLEIRDVKSSLEYLQSGTISSEKEGNIWAQMLGSFMLALAYFLNNDIKMSTDNLEKALEISSRVNIAVRPYPHLMELLWKFKKHDYPIKLDTSLEYEIENSLRHDNVLMKGIAFRYNALLKSQQGCKHDDIISDLELSLKYLKISGNSIEASKTRIEMAREYLKNGDNKNGISLAKQGFNTLKSFNDDLIPNDIRLLLNDSNVYYDHLAEFISLGKELATFRVHKDLVHHILSSVNRITKSERGAIFVVDANKFDKKLKLLASQGITQHTIDSEEFAFAWQIINEVVASRKGIVKSFYLNDNKSSSNFMRSAICIPMLLKNNFLGVFYHDNYFHKHQYNKSNMDILQYFASQAAVAIDNAKAYEEIQHLNQKNNRRKRFL